jgi:hypothetical protein
MMNSGAVARPGTYFFAIAHQTTCQIPFTNIRILKAAINVTRDSKSFIKRIKSQNRKNTISKVRKVLNFILNRGNFSLKPVDNSSIE